jgi:hypothetical protein
MMKRKIRDPVDMNVSIILPCNGPRLGTHQHEFFFHQKIDFQAGPMLGGVHDSSVDEASRDLID